MTSRVRYIFLIYSKELEEGLPAGDEAGVRAAHCRVMQEAQTEGVLISAEPLPPTASATTVRVENKQTLITDGPFAETKEQLAGFYILNCRDLDEAIEWAAKIPTACKGSGGCIEIRPMPGISGV